jgi:hypothetical protein
MIPQPRCKAKPLWLAAFTKSNREDAKAAKFFPFFLGVLCAFAVKGNTLLILRMPYFALDGAG